MSIVEASLRSPLLDWVDHSLLDGVSRARDTEGPILYVTSKKLHTELPLTAFDSSIKDVFLLGGRDRVVLGVGVAKDFHPSVSRLKGPRTAKSLAQAEAFSTPDASKFTVVGGWGFPPARGFGRAGIWRDFPASRWVVPALTLTSEGGETQLTLAVRLTSSDVAPLRRSYRSLVKALELPSADAQGTGAAHETIPSMESSRSIPSRKSWMALAREAIDSISKDELKKVVLARAVALTFRGKIPASTVLKRLVALNPDSTIFAIKAKGSVFLGATPESLMSVKNGDAEVDCLAATSPRSKDFAADETLGARMLRDSKSRREHEFVVNAAVRALSPISSSVEVPNQPVLKKLTTIQHLYTPVRAKLSEGKDAWDAALALWPNPAIGGEPKDKAVSWIRKFERFDRGWYSGVLGLLSARLDEADLVVGIRSGVIKGRHAVIYAGAGLVAGSKPQEEFEETSWKLETMASALGVDEDAVADGGR